MEKNAFTLAEVLITLGIIGIVAAMTMPVLINNHKRKSTVVRVQKAYSVVSQAVKLSEVVNGEYTNWNFAIDTNEIRNSDEFFKTYLEPYLQKVTFCSEGSDHTCGLTVSGNGVNYILNDGTSFSLFVPYNKKSLPFLVDINGRQRPNIIGKDVFYFSITEKGVLPFGWSDSLTRENIINGTTVAGSGGTFACRSSHNDLDSETDISKQYNFYMCTALLMMDGWQMKDDYPL